MAERGSSLKGLEHIYFIAIKSLSGSREPERLFYLNDNSKASDFASTVKVCKMIKVREMDIDIYWRYSKTLEAGRGSGWRFDEMKSCGAKFNSLFCAGRYDKQHRKFRDYEKESEQIMSLLALDSQGTVLDMGCGTGAFTINAAKCLKKVYAVDISQAMLRCVRKKAKAAGLKNLEFCHGGFLTYRHCAEPVDAIVSVLVLHHLPDFWKLVALRRLGQMLKTGGKFYLFDVVYSFNITSYESSCTRFIESLTERTGDEMKSAMEIHFSREYSTFGWIMEDMLEKAGFEIEKTDYRDDFFAAYLCTKKA
jgi:putative AdoMet-dependent methyltransferase